MNDFEGRIYHKYFKFAQGKNLNDFESFFKNQQLHRKGSARNSKTKANNNSLLTDTLFCRTTFWD